MTNEMQIIVLKQRPIIEFSAMEARGLEVADQIDQMNIDMIEASESSRSSMKKMRADLNKDLEVFEEQRKMIHGAITAPYKEFTDSYEANIKSRYKDAISTLKTKIVDVESKMLETKTADLSAYFSQKKGSLDFLQIDSLGLNIILSAPNKKLTARIDEAVEAVKKDIESISAMEHSVRIESLYKTNLDLSLSISTVLSDIERETELKEKREAEAKEAKEAKDRREEQRRIDEQRIAKERVEQKKLDAKNLEHKQAAAKKAAALNKSKEAEDEVSRLAAVKKQTEEDLEIAEQEKQRIETQNAEREKADTAAKVIHSMQFKVSGTISQLKEIKSFMDNLGVSYE